MKITFLKSQPHILGANELTLFCFRITWVNSLGPNDAIQWLRSGEWIRDCCLMAPSHYLNKCWLLICEFQRHSPKNNFTASTQAAILHDEFENYKSKITATSPRAGKVNLQEIFPWSHGLTSLLLTSGDAGPSSDQSESIVAHFLSTSSEITWNQHLGIMKHLSYQLAPHKEHQLHAIPLCKTNDNKCSTNHQPLVIIFNWQSTIPLLLTEDVIAISMKSDILYENDRRTYSPAFSTNRHQAIKLWNGII